MWNIEFIFVERIEAIERIFHLIIKIQEDSMEIENFEN